MGQGWGWGRGAYLSLGIAVGRAATLAPRIGELRVILVHGGHKLRGISRHKTIIENPEAYVDVCKRRVWACGPVGVWACEGFVRGTCIHLYSEGKGERYRWLRHMWPRAQTVSYMTSSYSKITGAQFTSDSSQQQFCRNTATTGKSARGTYFILKNFGIL